MRSTSVSLTTAVVVLVVVGMLPCMGWVQWFAALAAAVAIVVGVLGLLMDRESGHAAAHWIAIIAGVLGGGIGGLRCLLGGGLL